MKHKRFLFLLTAAVAFIIQLIDIISYAIKFSITQTFVLVIIQMIGLVGYAYDARNVVKNKRRMFTNGIKLSEQMPKTSLISKSERSFYFFH